MLYCLCPQLDQSEAAKAESGASSEKLEEMTDMVANLTSQMTDKNRVCTCLCCTDCQIRNGTHLYFNIGFNNTVENLEIPTM